MTISLRVIDSGLRKPRENLSITEGLCRGHKAGLSPDTLRFQHFPPSAIIGRHQLLAREVDLDWVAANDVATARRMTGGGAIIMGPGILGWELVIARNRVPPTLAAVSETICRGVCHGLGTMGVAAEFRPRNDIEVAGRKICGTGGYFDGGTLVFQGTVMIRLDTELLTHALRLPAHKLAKRGLSALSERLTDMASLLGALPDLSEVQDAVAGGVAGALSLDWHRGELTELEQANARTIHAEEIGTEAFVTGADDHPPMEGRTLVVERPTPAGLLQVVVKLLDGQADRADQVLIAGDFFVSPPRVIADLEAHLRHLPLARLADEGLAFLERQQAMFLGMAAADLAAALREASELSPGGRS